MSQSYYGDSKVLSMRWGNQMVSKLAMGGDVFWEKPPIAAYLTFQSNTAFTLKVYNSGKAWDGTLEYSLDTETWTEWTGSVIDIPDGTLYMRGTGNTIVSRNSTSWKWTFTGASNLRCIGNIEYLLDYETVANGHHPTMGSGCYGYLFFGCTALTMAPYLPATTLSTSCYEGMFINCSGLQRAPHLPAKAMAPSCYKSMFQGCTSLRQIPRLPATMLASSCYYSMFNGCSSIYLSTSRGSYGCYATLRIPSIGYISGAPSMWNANMFANIGKPLDYGAIVNANTMYYTNCSFV